MIHYSLVLFVFLFSKVKQGGMHRSLEFFPQKFFCEKARRLLKLGTVAKSFKEEKSINQTKIDCLELNFPTFLSLNIGRKL